jgi:hypothetical protein
MVPTVRRDGACGFVGKADEGDTTTPGCSSKDCSGIVSAPRLDHPVVPVLNGVANTLSVSGVG